MCDGRDNMVIARTGSSIIQVYRAVCVQIPLPQAANYINADLRNGEEVLGLQRSFPWTQGYIDLFRKEMLSPSLLYPPMLELTGWEDYIDPFPCHVLKHQCNPFIFHPEAPKSHLSWQRFPFLHEIPCNWVPVKEMHASLQAADTFQVVHSSPGTYDLGGH